MTRSNEKESFLHPITSYFHCTVLPSQVLKLTTPLPDKKKTTKMKKKIQLKTKEVMGCGTSRGPKR